jgi:hypothetical protein
LIIPMMRILKIIMANKAFAYISFLCTRLFKVESNVFLKTITNNRILWDVLYQLQLSVLLQPSLLLLFLCAIRQMSLVWKNEWKPGRETSISVLKAVNSE